MPVAQDFFVPRVAVSMLAATLDGLTLRGQTAPENFTVNFKLATILLRRGQADQAWDYCQRALQLMPNFVEGHVLLGDIHYFKYRRREALDEYLYAVHAGTNNAAAWMALGRYYFQEALYGDAVGAFAKAVSIEPNNAEAKAQLDLAEKRKRSGVLCARWAMAVVVMSPPQLSSSVMAMPSSTQVSRKSRALAMPPTLLIFRLTTSMARSCAARSSVPRSWMPSSSTKGWSVARRTTRHSS